MRFLQVAPNQPNAVIPKLKAVTDDVAESMLLITPRASHLVPKPYGLMCVATVPAQGSLLPLGCLRNTLTCYQATSDSLRQESVWDWYDRVDALMDQILAQRRSATTPTAATGPGAAPGPMSPDSQPFIEPECSTALGSESELLSFAQLCSVC